MLPTIYFIRHGETDWNRVQRYQGQTDIPLNELGREQAARNGRVLADLVGADAGRFHYVSSPLGRAAETMQIVRRELGLPEEPFARDDRLKEQHFGHWEGLLYSELPDLDPEGFQARNADMWGWVPRGGENYEMLRGRVAAWLQELPGDTIVASHGNVGRALRGIILGLDQTEIPRLAARQDRVLVIRDQKADWV